MTEGSNFPELSYYPDVTDVLFQDRVRPRLLASEKDQLRAHIYGEVWRERRGLPVLSVRLTELSSRDLNALSDLIDSMPLLAEAAHLVSQERVGAWDDLAHSDDPEERAHARELLRQLFRALPDAALREEIAEWHGWRAPDDEYGAAEVIAREVLAERSR